MTITFEVIQLVANLALIPLISTLFSMHGRLSRIEGHLNSIERKVNQ